MSLYKNPYFEIGLTKMLEDKPRRIRVTVLEEEDLVLTLIIYLDADVDHITNPDSTLVVPMGETMLHVEFDGKMHWIGITDKGMKTDNLVEFGRRVKASCKAGNCAYPDHDD